MPSPFPGMDPFIEAQAWDDFQAHFAVAICDALVPHVCPKYATRCGRRFFQENDPYLRRPVDGPRTFVSMQNRETTQTTTIIEVLKPAQKSRDSDAYRQYRNERQLILNMPANLVELDLLRGGTRLLEDPKLPTADYFAFVTRVHHPLQIEFYPWTLRSRMPTIAIPLDAGEPAVPLDLQTIFTQRYDSSDYDYSLHYDVPLEPPLSKSDDIWVRQILEQRH